MPDPKVPDPPDMSSMLEQFIESLSRGGTIYRSLVGEYLFAHVQPDQVIDYVITAWFIVEDPEEAMLFQASVLHASGMSFHSKIKILRALIGSDDAANQILKRIDKANELRNRLAHRMVVFVDDEQKMFRFEPADPKRPPMAMSDLRVALHEMQKLDTDLAETVVRLLAERRQFDERARRAAFRRALERYLADNADTDPPEA